MPEEQQHQQPPGQYTVQIHWPPDTYADATPANLFVFTDNGEQIFFAFAFLPPPPNVDQLQQGQELHYSVDRRNPFIMSRKTLLNLHRELTNFIDKNPHIFAPQMEPDDDADATTG